jgi:predicted MPP superfamily phosphohydrolase
MKIKAPRKKSKHPALRVLLIAAAVAAVIMLDSKLRITVTTYTRSYDTLPESFDGFRVVQLSDLHMADYGEKLYGLIRAQEPDIIVMTGDFLNRRALAGDENQTEKLRPILTAIAEIAPCYFVSGNHDWASGEIRELAALLSETGVRYLRNEFVLLERNGAEIALAGVEDPNGPADMVKPDALAQLIAQSYPDTFTLMLAHRNDFLTKYPALPVDVVLCGHAHGGIVRLPLVGGLLGTENNLFPKYDAGLFNEGAYDMILSRGLSNYIFEPRFLNNPELVTLILKKA